MEQSVEKLGLNKISKNMYQMILQFVTINDLRNLQQVCKALHVFINNGEFWNNYFRSCKTQFDVSRYHLSPQDMSKYAFRLQWLLNRDILEEQNSEETNQYRLPLIGVYSSSVDHDQQIGDTLKESPSLFWSSTGTERPDDRDEILFYSLKNGCSLICGFSLKFFRASFFVKRIYPCRRIRVEIGLDSNKLTYSEEFNLNEDEMNAESATIRQFKQAVFGKHIKFTLIGRVGIQQSDNQYYIAVERVIVNGIHFAEMKINESISAEDRIISETEQLMIKNGDSQSRDILEIVNYLKESNDLKLFDQFIELRKSKEAYEYLESQPQDFVTEYFINHVQQTVMINEYESMVVINQSINYASIVRAIIGCVAEALNEAKQQNENQISFEVMMKYLNQFEEREIPNMTVALSYERELRKIQALTINHDFLDILFKSFIQKIKVDPQEFNNKNIPSLNYERQKMQNRNSFMIQLEEQILPKICLKVLEYLMLYASTSNPPQFIEDL